MLSQAFQSECTLGSSPDKKQIIRSSFIYSKKLKVSYVFAVNLLSIYIYQAVVVKIRYLVFSRNKPILLF